jgi:L,D-transpeptidase catalytic domain
MRRSSLITTIALGAAVAASDAEARLDVYVDKSTQRLSVIRNGSLLYVWPVSTGRDRYSTPSGVYAPERLERSWFSKAYYNSPMPHAIFFHNGYAIHGSYDIAKLGGPASHGCVRLHPRDAALLYGLVEQEGPGNTAIFVGGNQNSASLRYRNFESPARPALRRDDSIAGVPQPGSMRSPGDGADRYVAGAGGYPPPGPQMPPYYGDRHVDGRGPYPSGPDGVPYYEPDRHAGEGRGVPHGPRVAPDYAVDPYTDARSAPHGPRIAPDYAVDPYTDARSAPHGPRVAPDYAVDPYTDARSAPHGPRVAPDYAVDPYTDARSVPHGPRVAPDYGVDPYADGRGPPRALNLPPDYAPDHRGDGRTDYPRTPPYYSTDRYADGPARRPGDQLTMRGAYPSPRVDGEAPFARMPRSNSRPVTSGAKSKPGRLADEPPNRQVTGGEAAKAPPPPAPWPASVSFPLAAPPSAAPPKPDPPSEPQQSNTGYKVLPRSYWAGASWRWRIKRDEEGTPHGPQ